MAIITTHLTPAVVQPVLHVGAYIATKKAALPASGVANGDNVQLLPITRGGRLFSTHLKTSATLGAGATVKAQLNRGGTRTDLTIATTAGGASVVSSGTIGAVDVLAGDVIELLVGGANISSAATAELDLLLQH